jgi:hypothetical protein
MPDIQITRVDPNTGITSMGMGLTPKILTGMDLLAQIVVLTYLKDPGKDVLVPNDGAGLRAAIGQYNFTGSNEIKLLVLQRTKFVEQSILAKQTGTSADPTERLARLVVTAIAEDSTTGNVVVRIRVTNEASQAKDVLV